METIELQPVQVIDRSRWCFGGSRYENTLGTTLMLNDEGYMCCLGHICKNSGYSDDDLDEMANPEDVAISTGRRIPLFVGERREHYTTLTQLTEMAIQINDNPSIPNEEREVQLTDLFEGAGIELQFVGEYPEGVR